MQRDPHQQQDTDEGRGADEIHHRPPPHIGEDSPGFGRDEELGHETIFEAA